MQAGSARRPGTTRVTQPAAPAPRATRVAVCLRECRVATRVGPSPPTLHHARQSAGLEARAHESESAAPAP